MKTFNYFVLMVALASTASGAQSDAPKKLHVHLDDKGSYLILATETAQQDYSKAIALAKQLHPAADEAAFAADDFDGAKKILRARQPHYVLLFIKPEELDVNFAWRWLTICTQLNDDPLVDVRTGIITGATPEDAAAFVQRTSDAVNGQSILPGKFVDNLGPNMQAGKQAFYQQVGSFIIPVLGERLALSVISHGVEAFSGEHLNSMDGAGLVHFGGHGHPDRVDDGLLGSQIKGLQLSPCVAFNGACYNGVTYRWYDQFNKDRKVAEETVSADDSFCLNLLRKSVLGYFASLHPDHGIPVYQEMEFLAYSGAPLGDVIKHTYDGVILASGGHLPKFERFENGMPTPAWSPSDIMLKGTASRVLFGDPSLIVADAFTDPPFKVTVKLEGDSLWVTATLSNTALKSTYTDTYFADLSSDKRLFNDRALIVADLPQSWDAVGGVEIRGITAPRRLFAGVIAGLGASGEDALKNAAAETETLKGRLVGYAVETDGTARRLQVQVDVPSEGYMRSPLRVAGATVELKVTRKTDPKGG